MNPLVSIVIPVYRIQEELLRKCIESCLNQTLQDIEIIIVDDCSQDHSLEICYEYAKQDDRVIVIHNENNEGLSETRNIGFRKSLGKWITFIDGDDWIEKDTCEYVKKILDDDIELAFFGMFRDYNNSVEVMDFPYEDMKIYYDNECKQLQIDILNYYKRISTVYGKFIRRDFLLKNNIFHDDEVRCGIEGIEFNLRLFGKLSRAISFNVHLYHYTYNLLSITGAPSEKTNEYVLLGISKMNDYILSLDNNELLYEQFQKRVARVIMDTSIACYFNPNYKLKYAIRKKNLNRFINTPVISKVFNNNKIKPESFAKKIIYYCTKNKIYFALSIIGKMRTTFLGMK